MSKSELTDGTWVIYERDHFTVYAEQPTGEVLVAKCNSTADADLISASKNLLAVVHRLMAYTGMDEADEEGAEAEGETFASIWREAREALAKVSEEKGG